MISITLLSSPLSAPAARELVETDQELAQLTALADRNEFITAAEQAAQLWRQQVYDVRTLGIYLLGIFMEQGVTALAPILSCIELACTTNWTYLGPARSKQKHLDGALRWLFINVANQLRFEKHRQGPGWQRILQQWEQAPQGAILESASRVTVTLGELLPSASSVGQLLGLRGLLAALPMASSPAAAAVIEVSGLATEPDQGGAEMKVLKGQEPAGSTLNALPAATVGGAPGGALGSASGAMLTLPISPPMQILLQKLAAFNALVKQSKFRQAAIVYNDMRQSIEKFDPRLYLPSLFGEYFSNIVTHATELTQSLEAPNDFATQALSELYHTDLERFIAVNG